MGKIHRNMEGYNDPTAGQALDMVRKEEREVERRIKECLTHIRWVAEKCDLAIVNRVRFRDLRTGKEYR